MRLAELSVSGGAEWGNKRLDVQALASRCREDGGRKMKRERGEFSRSGKLLGSFLCTWCCTRRQKSSFIYDTLAIRDAPPSHRDALMGISSPTQT